jgi:predicted nucleic acid-binding protein
VGFVVVYDASVLYPNTLRDLLLRLAQAGLVRARWTEMILDEVFEALARNRPELDADRLQRTRLLMGTAVRDWKISGFESLVEGIKLPDPDDRHVVAAAIRAHAQVIVTSNLRDFPSDALSEWDVEACFAGRMRARSDRSGPGDCLRSSSTDRRLLAQPARHD